MKIDEDIIFEQIENVRNELRKYIKKMAVPDMVRHGQNLTSICFSAHAQITLMKNEQIERDNQIDAK